MIALLSLAIPGFLAGNLLIITDKLIIIWATCNTFGQACNMVLYMRDFAYYYHIIMTALMISSMICGSLIFIIDTKFSDLTIVQQVYIGLHWCANVLLGYGNMLR